MLWLGSMREDGVCLCVLVTLALRTAHALPAGDVTTGQYRTLFPLTLSHTMLEKEGEKEREREEGGRERQREVH